ncbi:DUF676-domain-containing protein [Mycena leptocephala]|nr:DUF676-domain-containing protein [Mycena leptocephala]
MVAHLLVLVHGMRGNPAHLAELYRIVKDTYPDNALHVLLAETNKGNSTFDGIDWGGERVAEEIVAEVEKLQQEGRTVSKFSITGYSLGGLVARYVVGILSQRGFFKNVTPVNFNTLATPHLGLPRYPRSFRPSLLFSWSAEGRPLSDCIFYQALAAFQTIRIYANAINDRTVPYVTAAIEVDDVFAARDSNGLELEMDEEYAHLIKSYSVPPVPPPALPKPMVLSPSWFRGHKPSRPFLPPSLQFRFPINILVIVVVCHDPLLVPVFISLNIIRLSLAARSSRARIRLLEKDASNSQKIAHILAQLEKQVENAVVPSQGQPILTPMQRSMARSLNRLPLKKERTYFPTARNSHGLIICRNVKKFESHRLGEGVVRHWANHLFRRRKRRSKRDVLLRKRRHCTT